MGLTITIVGSGSTSSTPSESTASFFDIYSEKLFPALGSATIYDYAGAASTLLVGGLGKWAVAGVTEETAGQLEAAYNMGVDIPTNLGVSGIPSMAQGGGEQGSVGFFREMAGWAFGTAGGYAAGSIAPEAAAALASLFGIVALPEAIGCAVTVIT